MTYSLAGFTSLHAREVQAWDTLQWHFVCLFVSVEHFYGIFTIDGDFSLKLDFPNMNPE